MKARSTSRRDFLKSLAATAAAAKSVSAKLVFGGAPSSGLDAKGLPTARLGKTGRQSAADRAGAGQPVLRRRETRTKPSRSSIRPLDLGFYYWDTAYSYRNKDIISEERLGMVLKDRRKDVFLATKCESRTHDAIMREFEESLKRLQTDHLDLYQVHLIQSLADVDTLGAKDGAFERCGSSRSRAPSASSASPGISTAAAMAEAARRYDFDTMLIALNHYQERKGDMEGGAVRAAAAQKDGHHDHQDDPAARDGQGHRGRRPDPLRPEPAACPRRRRRHGQRRRRPKKRGASQEFPAA